MAYVTEPRYDNDPANKAYVDSKVTTTVASVASNYSKNFGAQPTPPYFVNDTWTDGADLWVCITERLIGAYNAADWQKATEYVQEDTMQTYVADELTTYNEFVEDALADLQTQIDNKAVIWFYDGAPTMSNEPAVNWTTTELKDEHIGDTYIDMETGNSYRFAYYESTYQWVQQVDSTSTAALAKAEEALDLADHKRTVFVGLTGPVPPYNVGDLWAPAYGQATVEANQPLYICKTEKLTGLYDSSHWVIATNADNTKTRIDGGLVTTGTLQVSDGAGVTKAGMTGNTSATSDNDIRIWAGATYENRSSSTTPFRVTQGGALYASNATIGGNITATSGAIGGFNITPTSFTWESAGYLSGIYKTEVEDYGFLVVYKKSDASYPFYVTQNGQLYAARANITGAITATSGSFTGAVYASSGSFTGAVYASTLNATSSVNISSGGWTINSDGINNGNSGFKSNGEGYLYPTGGAIFAVNNAARLTGPSGVSIQTSNGNASFATGKVHIQGDEGGVNLMTLNSSGQVNIRSYCSSSTKADASNGSILLAGANYITLYSNNAGTGVYAQGNGKSNARVVTDAGSASSLNTKEKLVLFDKNKYTTSVDILKQMNIYDYKYKYNLYDKKEQYGFIIDELQEIDNIDDFFTFEKEEATVNGDVLDFGDTDLKKEPGSSSIEVMKYNPDALDKYLLTVCKAQQMKIDELEERLNKLERK